MGRIFQIIFPQVFLVMSSFLWGNNFYSTVTVADFRDENYINQIENLNIGIELALLTPLADKLLSQNQYDHDMDALKSEMKAYLECFKMHRFSIQNVRIHQPGGYTYYWFDQNGFEFLRDFFSYCSSLGFRHFVVHSPYGNAAMDAEMEMNDYRNKLQRLLDSGLVEVEEIIASTLDVKEPNTLRFYHGARFEDLLSNGAATALLDVHECGSAGQTIQRMIDLNSKGFKLYSMHVHQNKHKILPNEEMAILLRSFHGNMINEGFLRNDHSFEEFLKTKSIQCIVPNDQRVEIMRGYLELAKSTNP